jgi:hypothetical protein
MRTKPTYEQNAEAAAQAEQQSRIQQIQDETRIRMEAEEKYRAEIEAARKASENAQNDNPLEN